MKKKKSPSGSFWSPGTAVLIFLYLSPGLSLNYLYFKDPTENSASFALNIHTTRSPEIGRK